MTLLEQLKDIHDRMQNPANWHDCGICLQIANIEDRRWFNETVKKWSKHSGLWLYPVPIREDLGCVGAVQKYETSTRYEKWDRDTSPYAALRWELLEWAIAELENDA